MFEGSFLLNMSFKISRKLRQKIEDSINKQALILIIMALLEFSVAVFLNLEIYNFISKFKEEKFLLLSFSLNLMINAFVITLTSSLGGRDCVISNSCFFFLFSSFKIYSFFLFRKFFRETQVTLFKFSVMWMKSKKNYFKNLKNFLGIKPT